MRGIVLFDHLDAGAAVLRNLIDVGAFQETETYVGMSQTIRGTLVAVAIDFQLFLFKDCVEEITLTIWKQPLRRLWVVPFLQALERQHCARHALAVTNASLPANLYFQDYLTSRIIFHDPHITVFKSFRFVGA